MSVLGKVPYLEYCRLDKYFYNHFLNAIKFICPSFVVFIDNSLLLRNMFVSVLNYFFFEDLYAEIVFIRTMMPRKRLIKTFPLLKLSLTMISVSTDGFSKNKRYKTLPFTAISAHLSQSQTRQFFLYIIH